MKTYSISSKEIKRRINAFTALLLSIFTGTHLFLFIFFPALFTLHLQTLIIISLLVILIGIILRQILINFFQSHLETKVTLSSDFIERKSLKSSNQYQIKDITKITLKSTTRHTIREVGLTFRNHTQVFFDGLTDMDDFVAKITKSITKNVTIIRIHEPLDFDSPAFYPILGFILSFISVFFFKFLCSINNPQIVYLSTSAYSFLLGLYFLFNKPLSLRYGHDHLRVDIIFALLFLVSAIIFSAFTLY
jgi:hypothetical protein